MIRLKNKMPITKGDLNHFSHRLNRYGFSKPMSAWVIILAAFVSGEVSFFLLWKNVVFLGLFLSLLLTFGSIFSLEWLIRKNGDKKK